MIKLSDGGVYLLNGTEVVEEKNAPASLNKAEAQKAPSHGQSSTRTTPPAICRGSS